MNLVLVRHCSNSCPYCFEATERERGKTPSITIDNVLLLAKWANKSGLKMLSLLGGEPFLHPKLKDIVLLLHRSNPEMSLRLLTGGIFNKQLLDEIMPEHVGLFFNINESRDYKNPKHFNKVIGNIEYAIHKGFNVVLGFNVWRLDFDPSFIPRLASRFGRSTFSWTVANPQRNADSNVVHPIDYQLISDRCFQMLTEATELGLEANLDCPVPMCFFSDSQLGWVRQYHPNIASSMGTCTPVIDVTPELDIIRCFALSDLPRKKLSDFYNEDGILDWFTNHIDHQLLNSGCFEACSTCNHRANGRCFGGCLASHSGDVDIERVPSVSLVQEMQNAVQIGDFASAMQQFEKANYWVRNDVSTFAASIAASRLGNPRLALKLVNQACTMTENEELLNHARTFITSLSIDHIGRVPEKPTTSDIHFISCKNQVNKHDL